MHLDPHTLHALVEKVRSQLRCPQCMKKVAVELQSLKVIGDSFAVFQLHCRTCEAHILLYATLRQVPASVASDGVQSEHRNEGGSLTTSECSPPPGARNVSAQAYNVSTTLELDPSEIAALRSALRETGGRFSDIFEESL